MFRHLGDEANYHSMDAIEITETDEEVDLNQIPMLEYEPKPETNLRTSTGALPEGTPAETKPKEKGNNEQNE